MRRLGLLLALAGAASALHGGAAWGASFAVDSSSDFGSLGSTADGICDADDGNAGVQTCTLRAAVREANGTPGADTITLPDLGAPYLLSLGPAGEDLAVGGDLDVRESVTITGSGQPVIDAGSADRVLHLGPASTSPSVSVNGVEVRGGGGAARGAGVLGDSGTTVLNSVTVDGNTASSGGGGARGGGVWLEPGGIHSIVASTISRNTADGQTGAEGGGLGVAAGAVVNIANSTISENSVSSAAGPTGGGGLSNLGIAALSQTTLHANEATGATGAAGGSIQGAGGGSTTLRASIISAGLAGAGTENCDVSGGSIISQGGNLEAPGLAGASQCNLLVSLDRFAGSAGVTDLADRGGPTETHALFNGSPALDAVPSCFPFASDQRGLPRPGGPACEIGSFERQVLAPPENECFGRIPTIVGTDGGEKIIGTPGPDVIVGKGGNDLIKSRGGKDTVCAGKGRDRVYGAGAADLIAGGDGGDRLFGQAGRDRLLGRAGRDFLNGGKRRDFLNGGSGRDTCRGSRKDKLRSC